MTIQETIESKIAGLLAPLKASGKLKSVEAVGGRDYETVLKGVMPSAPFALIKYTGKIGELGQGGIMHFQAEISILIGIHSLRSDRGRRMAAFEVLDSVEEKLSGKRLDSGFWPLVLVAESWSEITGAGLEVWEHRYTVQWEQTQ